MNTPVLLVCHAAEDHDLGRTFPPKATEESYK